MTIMRQAILFTLILNLLLCCVPYVKETSQDNMVRIAVVCGVNEVIISGVNNKQLYENHKILSADTFPQYFSPRNDVVTVNKKKYTKLLFFCWRINEG